jgi:hypothetical protein
MDRDSQVPCVLAHAPCSAAVVRDLYARRTRTCCRTKEPLQKAACAFVSYRFVCHMGETAQRLAAAAPLVAGVPAKSSSGPVGFRGLRSEAALAKRGAGVRAQPPVVGRCRGTRRGTRWGGSGPPAHGRRKLSRGSGCETERFVRCRRECGATTSGKRQARVG